MKKELYILLILGTTFTLLGACNRNNEVSRAYHQNADKQTELMREKSERKTGKVTKTGKRTKTPLDARATLSQDDIRIAQSKLIDLGYLRGTADGVIGKDTVIATKRFQADENLPITGVFSKNTMDHLDTAKRLAE